VTIVHTLFLLMLCAATAWLALVGWVSRHED
jgi:hypothetical protein